MKIRYQISLWIASITLLVATVAGFFVYYEMSEESYDLIDKELLALSERLISTLQSNNKVQNTDNIERYYVRVSTKQGENVYQSRLAKLVTIDSESNKAQFSVNVDISYDHLGIEPGKIDDLEDIDSNNTLFRVLVREDHLVGQNLIISVAKPLPFMTGDFKEVRQQIVLWSFLTTFVVIYISYLLAGKILAPINVINSQIREINQTSLSHRITLGKSKDELHELSVSLNSMFERLESSFEKQREFIGNAAHEIKTPITALLLGHENLLSNSPPQEISDEIESQLNVLRRVSLLVKNLLDISRLEQQDVLDYETFCLSDLVDNILYEFEGIISSMEINLTKNMNEVQFSGDKLKIQRMLVNIIDNALKYNKKNGYINVSLNQSKETAHLEISNTSSGISPMDLLKIFDQFYRVDKSHSSRISGFGLGLTIVKKIVEIHDGTISASSTDCDTSIYITLPIRQI